MEKRKLILLLLSIMEFSVNFTHGLKNIVYAINAGGDNHIDVYGVHYKKDPSNDGIASDYGMQLNQILRVGSGDEILYRTERYSHDTFGYDIPIKDDGDYVLVLKFCEVYFNRKGAKVFDVVLNKKHFIVPELDIYSQVGKSVAHDEIIPFKITNKGKKLIVSESKSQIEKGKIPLQFVKGSQDNPKINAFYVVKGKVEDVPRLPEMIKPEDQLFEDEAEEDDELIDLENYDHLYENSDSFNGPAKVKKQAAQHNPWDDESLLNKYLPVIGAVGLSFVATVIVVSVAK